MKKTVLIAFGGISAEHEVSVITGLQVAERIDRTQYAPYCIYVTKDGRWLGYGDLPSRKDFKKVTPVEVAVGRDNESAFLKEQKTFGKTVRPYAAYFAFHGGTGESGPTQGVMEAFGIPYTGPDVESAVITMNKALGKEVLAAYGLPVVPGVALHKGDILADAQGIAERTAKQIGLPAIVKPAHLGSSIGINVAKTVVELEKHLLTAAHMDSETVVEMFLPAFKEYNCSVRGINGEVETSEIESPVAKDAILSFADKYQRGGKKTGGESGMASLQRELPAKISPELRNEIMDIARRAYLATRGKSMARIDFMVTPEQKVYITEINPIPGSMAFYLWEAKGITFTQQITDMLEQSILDHQARVANRFDYPTNIIDTFVDG